MTAKLKIKAAEQVTVPEEAGRALESSEAVCGPRPGAGVYR